LAGNDDGDCVLGLADAVRFRFTTYGEHTGAYDGHLGPEADLGKTYLPSSALLTAAPGDGHEAEIHRPVRTLLRRL
jgi:hypothetical protein